MTAVVVVPLARDNDDARAADWHYVRDRLISDGWPIVEGHSDTPWIKAAAVDDALRQAPGRDDDVLIVLDADCLVDLHAIRAAVHQVETGAHRWAIPHTLVYRLTEAATADQLSSPAPQVLDSIVDTRPPLTRWPYVGIEGGGCVVLRRETYVDTPLDRRFVGWGTEDQAWGWALETLHGAPWRSSAALVHLWHPHASPGAQRSMLRESERLRRAYRAYRRHPREMRTLVAGAR